MDPSLFSSKVYLVTGGNRGIGFAITSQLLDYDAFVYVVDIGQEPSPALQAIANERLYYHSGDVRDRIECQALLQKIVGTHSRLDGLVNNAAICPLEGASPDDSMFDEVIDVNLNGVWNYGTAAIHQMKTQSSGGSIVNIGSTSSLVGVGRLPAYTASKHAVLGLTRSWAIEFAGQGIRVNCVAPGGTDTAMARTPLRTVMGPRFGMEKSEDELLEMVAKSIPVGRIGKPEEIANTVCFLLSELASYVTGQIVHTAGGVQPLPYNCGVIATIIPVSTAMADSTLQGDSHYNIQNRFLSTRGMWNEDWAALLQQSPRYFEYYLNLREAAGLRRNRLPPKIQEFICIAVATCTTHIHGPAIRCHIHAARAIGATADEIMDVIGLTQLVGIHTVTLGAPILQELIEEEGITIKPEGVDSDELDRERQRIKNDFIGARGFWTDTWNPFLDLDPVFFEAYSRFSANASSCQRLEPKHRELIVCAFDVATTHLYGRGTKIHMRNALRLGATPDEIMEMLEITSLMGIDGVTAGARLLVEQLEHEKRA
ncbi:hypothetical protein PENARI_c005G02786 [Penicillium arizonense]|uniref:Carboxymuconolactone decarboxylase-like domain-containing protein n=1 Tax=Penicillium arizonense TaxID=1835702 RepID=A0A1F5LP32_PENAI|nr:hypothetical protein PENARI_c005G02786 [Penicillium arizonense]OGE54877.1 hypothetical protein PENARI_c005G02786 [Penicillium arizonense]